MFANIGYFHFGKNHSKPIDSLGLALLDKGKDQVCDSLIVLPEGFNIGRYYHETGMKIDSPEILSKLKLLAKEYGSTFVAGLIISNGIGPTPPFSTAYLIDIDGCRPMCRKEHEDGSMNYSVCPQKCCDIENPINYMGACIGTLICMDADNKESVERYRS